MTKKIDRQANDGIEQACVLPGYRQQNAATKKPPLILRFPLKSSQGLELADAPLGAVQSLSR
jgi:hypothetical protein